VVTNTDAEPPDGGGVEDGAALTNTVTGADVAAAPESSTALAVRL
jgi:hypothetical protein